MKAGKNLLLFLFKGEPASIIVTCCWWWWCYLNFSADGYCLRWWFADLLYRNFSHPPSLKETKIMSVHQRGVSLGRSKFNRRWKSEKTFSQLVLTTVQTDEKHSKFTMRLAFFRSSSASVLIAFGFDRWNSVLIVSFTVENINKFCGNLCEMR